MPTVHLTAQTAKELSAGQTGRTDYFDTDVRGFGLRVTASSIKSWTFTGWAAGCGATRYPDLSLADARDPAKGARSNVAHEVDPGGVKVEMRHADPDRTLGPRIRPSTCTGKDTIVLPPGGSIGSIRPGV